MVLFASYSGSLGGAERLLVEWASTLDGERCLACPEGELAQAARARGLRVLPVPTRSLEVRGALSDRLLSGYRLVGHARELRALVANLDPDLVVVWGMRSALALILGPRLRPATVFQHNDLLPGPAIGWLVRGAAARAGVVTVPSRAVAGDLDPHGRLDGRLEVVPPGVDLERFGVVAPPAEPPEVLVLGALVPWKRPDLALDAVALARRHHPDLHLRLVGAPIDQARDRVTAAIQARASEPDLAGAVELAGPSDDPAAELARATCLLHCAEREPFGIAALEALAAGRPAIVPAAAGPAEIVDSSCGLLYPPGDARGAADALVRLVSDPPLAARMGAAGRERARSQFDAAAARERWTRAVARARGARPPRRAPGSAERTGARDSLELVTVTYNSAWALGCLLDSVERHLSGVRVLVVDCASSDGTVAIARSRSARVIALDQNVGFGRAANHGVARVSAPVTALLNPDVELVDDSLLALVATALEAGGAERLLAPLVLSGDGSRQDSVHPVPGSPAELIRSLISPTVLPSVLARRLDPWRARTPRPVGWAVGCALVGRTQTLVRLGPFDERIFLYGEDLDLGLRAAQDGVRTWFCPAARVVHHGAHSTGPAFGGEPYERLARARRDTIGRRLGTGRLALDDASQALTFASRTVAKRAIGRPAARERRQLEALVVARRRGG